MGVKTKTLALILTLSLGLAGCAGHMPVPGGNDTINPNLYKTADDMLSRVQGLQRGMTEAQAFTQLGVSKDNLQNLNRAEIVTTLFGSNALQIGGDPAQQQALEAYLQSLQGYRLDFRNTQRKHGFVNPIRVRTDDQGFAYSVSMVFENGLLKEVPVITGGKVNDAHSKTIFDIFTPADMLGRAI